MKNSFRNVLISALVIMFLYQFTACSRPTLPDKIIVLDEEIMIVLLSPKMYLKV